MTDIREIQDRFHHVAQILKSTLDAVCELESAFGTVNGDAGDSTGTGTPPTQGTDQAPTGGTPTGGTGYAGSGQGGPGHGYPGYGYPSYGHPGYGPQNYTPSWDPSGAPPPGGYGYGPWNYWGWNHPAWVGARFGWNWTPWWGMNPYPETRTWNWGQPGPTDQTDGHWTGETPTP